LVDYEQKEIMMLKVEHLRVVIDDLVLAEDMSFGLEAGKVHVIVGPNGTGKSTLLKTLFGEVKRQSGDISCQGLLLDDKKMASWRKQFGYMPQDTRLDAGLSVLEVVLLGQLDALSFRLEESMIQDALIALDEIGLVHLANRDVSTLSGGQCQMILFAQALMRKPKILMLDEPVSALDLHFQHVLLEHLAERTKKENWISVLVLHDLNLSAQYADNLLVLKDGKVIDQGHPNDVLTSAMIQDVYNINAEILRDSSGMPLVRTVRKKRPTVSSVFEYQTPQEKEELSA